MGMGLSDDIRQEIGLQISELEESIGLKLHRQLAVAYQHQAFLVTGQSAILHGLLTLIEDTEMRIELRRQIATLQEASDWQLEQAREILQALEDLEIDK